MFDKLYLFFRGYLGLCFSVVYVVEYDYFYGNILR